MSSIFVIYIPSVKFPFANPSSQLFMKFTQGSASHSTLRASFWWQSNRGTAGVLVVVSSVVISVLNKKVRH